MRAVLRVLGLIALWVLAIVAGLFAFLCAVLVVAPENGDQRLGAIVLLPVALGVLAGAVWGLRRMRAAKEDDGAAKLAAARERLRAGEPIVLRASRRRWSGLLVVGVLLTAGSVWAFAEERSIIAAVGVLLFGASTVLSVLQLLPGRAALHIGPDGLVARGPVRSGRWDWNDVEHFTAYDVDAYGMTQQVGFDQRDMTPERQGVWRTLGRGIAGVDAALPDTYGLRGEDLAALLEEARERYATEHGMSASARADLELLERAERIPRDRVPLVTALLCAACLVLYVRATIRHGVAPSALELLDDGAATRDSGWWTLLSANLLHGNPVHLVLNLVALGLLGTLLEREVGWPRFGLVCLAGAVAAMGGAVLLRPDAVTVGISGVVFAIAGWAVLRDVHRTRALGVVAWAILPVGVIATFFSPNISIGAHLGGLLAGLALGWAFERRRAAGSVLDSRPI